MTTEKALQLFDLKKKPGKEELKKRFRYLLKKYHPDISLSENSHEMTQKVIDAYYLLQKSTESKSIRKDKLIPDSSEGFDWLSQVRLIDHILFVGTYSGRVFGLDYNKLKEIISNIRNLENQKDKNAIFQSSLFLLQIYEYKTPKQDLNAIFNLESEGDNLIVETSQNPFAKKEMKQTWTDYKRYVVPLKKYLLN